MSQTLTIIVLSTYRWNTSRCIFNPRCAIAIFLVQLYTSSIPLRLGNNLPVANFHRWAAITGFSREVPHEGVTAQLIRLPGVTRAHCVLAHNRLICMMVTNGNVQAIVHRRLQRIIDIIASTQKSEDGEVFVPSFKLLCNRYKP